MAAESPDTAGSPNTQRVAVVGGGISGLAAACRLRELRPHAAIELYEAAPRLGGVLHTERRDGYLLEHSADNFITDVPWGLDFCQRLGCADELIPTTAGNRRAGIVSRGRIESLPEGFALLAPSKLAPLLASPLLSGWGKLRLACEYFVPRRQGGDDESFASFARRRLGREAYERIAQPLVSGIYTADPERLSMQGALARFVEMERREGSLIRAARRAQRSAAVGDESGPRYGLFVAPRGGMEEMIEAAAGRLQGVEIHFSTSVTNLSATADAEGDVGWRLALQRTGGTPSQAEAGCVILATPSWSAAALVRGVDAELADELQAIEYAGCTIALVGCRADQIERKLDGFGFVVPEVEKRAILACSYASAKFPERAPAGRVLLRVFVGGACHPEFNELGDAPLRQLVLDELRALIGLTGAPELFETVRWPRAMPQYHVGHLARMDRIERRLAGWPTLALAGAAYRGVGIPHCIRSGELAAERIAAASV